MVFTIFSILNVYPDQRKEIPLPRRGMIHRDGRTHILKWILPMFFAMLGFYIQSVGLHYATYQYVHQMLKMPEKYRDDLTYSVLPDPVGNLFPPMKGANDWIHVLDAVAACFPALFMAISFGDFCQGYASYWSWTKDPTKKKDHVNTLQTFTKIMTCAGFLFMLKGTVGAVTTVPDSSGWKVCKERLTVNGTDPRGLQWMTETHTLVDMLSVDYQFNLEFHHPLRYCSDMMYSGHTFVVTLFALGCYEQLRIVLSVHRERVSAMLNGCMGVDAETAFVRFKSFCLLFFAGVAVAEQILEIYFVEKTHFHYTMDVLMAIVVTMLFFTNGAIVIFARQWEQRGVWFFLGRYPAEQKDLGEDDEVNGDVQAWISRGDLFIPPCCVPCCCLVGREHLYSDRLINTLFETYVTGKVGGDKYNENAKLNHDKKKLFIDEMNLFEGAFQRNQIDLQEPLIIAGP